MFNKLKIRSKILLPIILIFAVAFTVNEILGSSPKCSVISS